MVVDPLELTSSLECLREQYYAHYYSWSTSVTCQKLLNLIIQTPASLLMIVSFTDSISDTDAGFSSFRKLGEAMADAVPTREMSSYTYKQQQALREADGIQAPWTHTGSSGQWKVPSQRPSENGSSYQRRSLMPPR